MTSIVIEESFNHFQTSFDGWNALYALAGSISSGTWPMEWYTRTVSTIQFTAMPKPPPDIARLIALLAWIPPNEFKEYYSKIQERVNDILDTDQQWEKWKKQPLYMNKTKDELKKTCRKLKIPVTPSTNKHQLVLLISRNRGDPEWHQGNILR